MCFRSGDGVAVPVGRMPEAGGGASGSYDEHHGVHGACCGRKRYRSIQGSQPLTIPVPPHSRTDALHPIHNISRYEKSFSVFRNRNCGTVPGGNRVILPDLALEGGLSSWSPRAKASLFSFMYGRELRIIVKNCYLIGTIL